MLTFLDILNRFLGYFNIQDKAKGKAFTVVAFVANFYLLYVAIQNLRYVNYRVQGALFLAAFLVLTYFIVLNFFYYYTDRAVKFDISPWIEQRLGGNQAQLQAAETALAQSTATGAASGLIDADQILPTTVTTSPAQQQNLDNLVAQLVKEGRLGLNYAGLDEQAILRIAQQSQQPVSAMGALVELPYFALQTTGHDLHVLAGVNALNPVVVARIEQVGLMPTRQALKDYRLVAAHVYLTGGETKRLGRRGLITSATPYAVTVQVAYRQRER